MSDTHGEILLGRTRTWHDRMKRLLPICMAIALALLAGSTDAWAKADGPAPATQSAESAAAATRSTRGTATAPSTLDPSYAAREAQAKGLEKFEGGDAVVITTTTLVVVLLVILILVLI
jgi:hypothetical protein